MKHNTVLKQRNYLLSTTSNNRHLQFW